MGGGVLTGNAMKWVRAYRIKHGTSTIKAEEAVVCSSFTFLKTQPDPSMVFIIMRNSGESWTKTVEVILVERESKSSWIQVEKEPPCFVTGIANSFSPTSAGLPPSPLPNPSWLHSSHSPPAHRNSRFPEWECFRLGFKDAWDQKKHFAKQKRGPKGSHAWLFLLT